jgi:hypothetical protein
VECLLSDLRREIEVFVRRPAIGEAVELDINQGEEQK